MGYHAVTVKEQTEWFTTSPDQAISHQSVTVGLRSMGVDLLPFVHFQNRSWLQLTLPGSADLNNSAGRYECALMGNIDERDPTGDRIVS